MCNNNLCCGTIYNVLKLILIKERKKRKVERLLEFRAHRRPDYLSLIFTDNVRSKDIKDITEDSKEAISNFQKLDPLTKALDMAEQADNFSSAFQEIT